MERRPVEAGARAKADISEDEIRVPLMEEELVVAKRPVVKEQLVLWFVMRGDTAPQTGVLLENGCPALLTQARIA